MKKAITNTTAAIMFVAGKMINPGENRTVEVKETPTPSSFTGTINIESILSSPVAKLDEVLAPLKQDALQQLIAAEAAGQNRKTAISKIESAIKEREYDSELSEFALALSSVEELDPLLLEVADDETKTAMVQDEMAKRAEQLKNDNK